MYFPAKRWQNHLCWCVCVKNVVVLLNFGLQFMYLYNVECTVDNDIKSSMLTFNKFIVKMPLQPKH